MLCDNGVQKPRNLCLNDVLLDVEEHHCQTTQTCNLYLSLGLDANEFLQLRVCKLNLVDH